MTVSSAKELTVVQLDVIYVLRMLEKQKRSGGQVCLRGLTASKGSSLWPMETYRWIMPVHAEGELAHLTLS